MSEGEPAAPQAIRSIAIVGGGTAGWSVAAQLSHLLRGSGTAITVIESSDVPTVGVGEATIPPIFEFLHNCGIDEVDFIRACDATFKLAIRFEGWLKRDTGYWHPFGNFGMTIDRRPFHHHWWRLADVDGGSHDLADYCPAIALAERNRLTFPPHQASFPGSALTFALHFDAGKVADFLARHAMANGVARVVGTVADVETAAPDRVARLHFADRAPIEADLYIDCSGFAGLLIERALRSGYADWRDWLPCDRAVAMPTRVDSPRTPYTLAAAQSAGWRWRIPLRSRCGNGYVYCSRFIGDDAAVDELMGAVDAPPLAEPRLLRFTPGHRERPWIGNVVAIGLAAGFLEPLESTSIHLIHTAINRLLDYWPDRRFDPVLADAFNRETRCEYAHIRDFLMLHYLPNRRVGEPFWDHVRDLPMPESLAEKLAMFTRAGRIVSRRTELFSDISWFFVAAGMGLRPASYDPLVTHSPLDQVDTIVAQMRGAMSEWRSAAPAHDELLDRLCDPGETRRPDFALLRGARR